MNNNERDNLIRHRAAIGWMAFFSVFGLLKGLFNEYQRSKESYDSISIRNILEDWLLWTGVCAIFTIIYSYAIKYEKRNR
jgi:hypothetical protein